ncbi:MAG: LysM peptidoglycan-binding domain-containing protein, partial [Omnitrophica WOR_2 bacterium]
RRLILPYLAILGMFLSACDSAAAQNPAQDSPDQLVSANQPTATQPAPVLTPFPTRPAYNPGELVDYTVQTGDTVPALATHFNTTVDEIMAANPIIPASVTTLPPGMPMKIPIYYAPLWGSPYQILPDSLFIDGPAAKGFNTQDFVSRHKGWLAGYSDYVSDKTRSGAEIVDLVGLTYSVSPRLLLALLEYQTKALSQPALPADVQDYPLGYADRGHKGLYMQLVWAANTLNNGYYSWRTGHLVTIDLLNGRIERFDPWQNAASVAIHYYFSKLLSPDDYALAISPEGLAKTYLQLYGDPWQSVQAHIPGSLSQPELTLPFLPGKLWAFTGGPHTGWGLGEPYSAIDFAPPSVASGCRRTEEWATAIAPGIIVRSEPAIVVLDLDGDGDERTGWVIFYLHIETEGRIAQGTKVKAGDAIGHPSCEGGQATGTHVHIARKYNGEWIPADGPLAFNLEGWVVHDGSAPYQGTLTRFTHTVVACTCSDQSSQLASQPKPASSP